MLSAEVGPSSAKWVLWKRTGSGSSNDAGFGECALSKTCCEDESMFRAPGDAGFTPALFPFH